MQLASSLAQQRLAHALAGVLHLERGHVGETGAQVVDPDGSMHTMRSKAAIDAPPGLITEIISLIHRSQKRSFPRRALYPAPTNRN